MDERVIGHHQRVIEGIPQSVRPSKERAWPLMECLDCGLTSQYEEEFLDNPCPKKK